MQAQTRQKAISNALIVALVALAAGALLWWLTDSLAVAADTLFSTLLALTTLSAQRGLRLVAQRQPPAPSANLLILFAHLLIVLLGLWLVIEAVLRTFTRLVDIQVNLWALLVMLVLVILKAQRANHLAKLTRATADQSLDLLSFLFNTSKWTSALALASLLFSDLGSLIFFFEDLLRADSLVALGISLALLLSAGRLAYLAFNGMRRANDPETSAMLKDGVEAVSGVRACPRLLLAFSGAFTLADLDIDPGTPPSANQAQILLGEIETAIHRQLPLADINITLLPTERSEG